jgi:hypothetical protein
MWVTRFAVISKLDVYCGVNKHFSIVEVLFLNSTSTTPQQRNSITVETFQQHLNNSITMNEKKFNSAIPYDC